MTDKFCIVCGFPKPATPAYFYRDARMRGGLRGECKPCSDMARFLRKRKQRLAAGKPFHRTPPALKGTPEFALFVRRRGAIYQRIGRARKQGRLHALPRLYAWLEEIKHNWYAGVNG